MLTTKSHSILGLSIIVVIVIIIILRLTGSLQIYKMYNTAMEPTLKKRSIVIVSNMVELDVGKLIIVSHNDSLRGKGKSVYRIIGVENDTIEISNGLLYRNGKDYDGKMDLVYEYVIPMRTYNELKQKKQIINDYVSRQIGVDSMLVQLSTDISKLKDLEDTRFIRPVEDVDEYIQNQYGYSWNKSNFGPIVVPQGKFFVLGDNRDDSFGSRYIGFVNRDDILGSVILH